ncbi:HlyD family efflux transporter periplasmic adaptor subunit [Massilia glaciei]|uniref:HlyD family secretion protein n=1 Tax=Massilia glaciei TaxID=1524097 RepID=A0A2U2HE45_9BURK|nr:HlyD family efflux transporter periplasmic adaptor subunit [Massilia glaciei]PWF41577.1 HlyD family secretion protein [Massilia glaciei]
MSRAALFVLAALGAAGLMAAVAAPPARPALAAGEVKPARPVLLTGEVEALGAQTVFVPPSNSRPVVLRYMVAEGASVKAGDVVLRIETGDAANIDRLKTEIAQTRAKAEREGATLEVAAVMAEKAVGQARAALAKARIDAALPKAQIAALDYDRYQGELEHSTRDLVVKQKSFDGAREAVARRRADGELEAKKQQINLLFKSAQMAESEVRAAHDGIVVHGYNAWSGERYEEGTSAHPGNSVAQVHGAGKTAVSAWVLEADRAFLAPGQSMRLRFDALPSASLDASIASITSAPEARAVWGLGRYFRVRITLPDGHALPLVPGMSVMIEPRAGAPAGARLSAVKAAQLTIEGEIASRSATPVAPPTIPYVWNFTLNQLAPEGSMVEAGQPLAVFGSNDVMTRLESQKSSLNEKLRALEKMRLDQAEGDRAGDLAVAEAASNADKAARKASQPKELIRRIDYDKLVIERTLGAELAKLAVAQRKAEGLARRAERSGLEAEIAQLKGAIDQLEKGRKGLAVLAPRKGRVLHRTNFNGEKFNIGSQVWMGSSIATLADPDQLFINAKVPEAQTARVRVGQRAKVTVTGSNEVLTARVSALGRIFHGKSSTQPVIVRDVELEFDSAPKGLKPGAAVQATLLAGEAQPAKQIAAAANKDKQP